MVGQIATFSPGDKINVTYKRDGKESTIPIVLRNNAGTTAVIRTSVLDKLGADLQTLSKKDATSLDLKGGVVVKSVTEGGLMDKSRIQEGFIILKANGEEVKTVEDFQKIVEKASRRDRKAGRRVPRLRRRLYLSAAPQYRRIAKARQV